ncbi:MAG: radical SAM protein, partial [Acidobacteria bacterium]|nr:radical SAM protein [Acidobacteriota bacterium]
MPLGLYISIPFCRSKCTYCNFASGVFSRTLLDRYLNRLCSEIETAQKTAEKMGAPIEPEADSLYFGGGTPTLLDLTQLEHLFVTIRQNFTLAREAEITLECAPGTLSSSMASCLAGCGVNRVSLGVQSFGDREAALVGRLHRRETVLQDIGRLREAGISNINIDLIAGLPCQTAASWQDSIAE